MKTIGPELKNNEDNYEDEKNRVMTDEFSIEEIIDILSADIDEEQ